VVEGEDDDASVITADAAAFASLIYQDALELLLATCDGLADAAFAGPSTPNARSSAVQSKLGQPMPLTVAYLDRTLSGGIGRAASLLDKRDWGDETRVGSLPVCHKSDARNYIGSKDLQIESKVPPPGLEPGLRD
jgi:hypothetical protein